MGESRRFTMPFEPTVIEHLGLRLYSTLPPVISELVSNAYDADAALVEIVFPTDTVLADTEVIVRDYGHGLSAAELQTEYLPIGRNRRGSDHSNLMSKSGSRRVTGRKGLGKLSAFGVAGEMEIATYKDAEAICLRLDYNDMLEWARSHPYSEPYEPAVVVERTGPTTEKNGVEVRLRQLHRKRAISEDVLRRGLARRLQFIGSGFMVRVNGTPIQPGDRAKRTDCQWSWDLSELPHGARIGEHHQVSGWIGFTGKSSQADRGIDIFANNKAVELSSFFNYPSTHAQFARAHVVGEVQAGFLDEDDDLIATARNSVVWESEAGLALQDWGRNTLKWAFGEWVKLRRKEKEEEVIRTAGFDKWLQGRQPSEQRVAKKMVRLLVDDPDLDPDSAAPLLEIVKASVETVAFRVLVETIEAEGGNLNTLLKLFDEWRVIEAREHLKLADGRMEAMLKLEGFINTGALEVQQMQPLMEEHLWLIDPSWAEANGQTTYTKMLREHCTEPKDYEDVDRRIDILGIRTGGELCVVELKRPEKTLSRRDLDQIAKYVDWARNQFEGTAGEAPKYTRGLLVVGTLSSMGDVQRAQKRLAGDDIRVETYGDLLERAKEYYGQVEQRLKTVAPEYVRSRRKIQQQAKDEGTE